MLNRRPDDPETTIQHENGTPRSGRPARGRKSGTMQLSLDNGAADFRPDSDDRGLPGPSSPVAGHSDSRRGGDEPSDGDAEIQNRSRSGRIIASLPDSEGLHRPPSAPTSPDSVAPERSDDTPRTTQTRRSGRRRDETERENAAATKTPEPTPIPKPVEPREKPDAPAAEPFRRARVRSQPQPQYPQSARAANQQGDTTLRLSISAEGDVVSAEVVASSGSAALDEAAARGARRWKYDPARQGDAAVASSVRAVVRWHLED